MSGLAAAGGCRKEIKFAFSPAFSVFIYLFILPISDG